MERTDGRGTVEGGEELSDIRWESGLGTRGGRPWVERSNAKERRSGQVFSDLISGGRAAVDRAEREVMNR